MYISRQSSDTVWLRCIRQTLRDFGWAPVVVFATHVVLLLVFDAYTEFAALDLPMHFIGGVAMAYVLHGGLINACQMEILAGNQPIADGIFVFTGTTTVAVFWEFGEFFADQTFGTRWQPSVGDTMTDLLLGVVGAGLFVFWRVLAGSYPRFSRIQVLQRLQNPKSALGRD